MTVDFGYGVDMSRVKFKSDAAKHVLENYATREILEEYREYCEYNTELVDDGVAEEAFVEDYEDDGLHACGLEALLTRCINDRECDGENIFWYDDYCIYVGARIPKDDVEKSAMLTMQDICRILASYLNPVLDAPANIETLEIND